jgi:hypothetical protein
MTAELGLDRDRARWWTAAQTLRGAATTVPCTTTQSQSHATSSPRDFERLVTTLDPFEPTWIRPG